MREMYTVSFGAQVVFFLPKNLSKMIQVAPWNIRHAAIFDWLHARRRLLAPMKCSPDEQLATVDRECAILRNYIDGCH